MSQQPPKQSDFDDQSSVMIAAAAKRENSVSSNAPEPLSLWVIIGSAIVMVIAGGVLFSGGHLFDYDNTVKDNYVRSVAPGEENAGPKPKPAMTAYTAVGSKIFTTCIVCHGAEGKGTEVFPPLAKSEWVNGPSLRPAMIILNGCEGPITVAGKSFNNKMPPQGAGMDAKKLAGILNYIRNHFGNTNEKLITMEMAQDALDTNKERGSTDPMTADELNAKYKRELKGAELDPKTLVDPKTLKPVK